jgi:predicted Zn-dependent protease with MMP-like domain
MNHEEFEKLVSEEFPNAIPEKFRGKIKNVAFLVEDVPSAEVRQAEHLGPNHTLLGYYRGIPHSARGDSYGVGATLPDTITLYQLPIEAEAAKLTARFNLAEKEAVQRVVRDTIWHEVAHHFGMNEHEVRRRERKRGV